MLRSFVSFSLDRFQVHDSLARATVFHVSCNFKCIPRSYDNQTYDDVRRHFNELEILELGVVCWQVEGGGKMARLINVVSWDEACSLNPALRTVADSKEVVAAWSR